MKMAVLRIVAVLIVGLWCVKGFSYDYYAPYKIPDDISHPDYILFHFWDDVNSECTDEELEAQYIKFLELLPETSLDGQCFAFGAMAKKVFKIGKAELFLDFNEKYLYELDSKYADDEKFIMMTSSLVDLLNINEVSRIRPEALLQEVELNRVGRHPNNFEFETPDGKKMKLQDFGFGEGYEGMILFFYDPECGHCMEIMDRFKNFPMPVLAIYSGENKELWERMLWKVPENWIVGWEDGTIQEKNIYVLRSMPTLYYICNYVVLRKNFENPW